jgi:hypothetical protein
MTKRPSAASESWPIAGTIEFRKMYFSIQASATVVFSQLPIVCSRKRPSGFSISCTTPMSGA